MIDCHFHLDESMVSIPGLLASMDLAGIEKAILIPRLNPPLATTPLIKYGAKYLRGFINSNIGFVKKGGLAFYKGVVKNDGTVDVGGKRYEVYRQPPNDEVTAAVEKHPDRFMGWIFINPAGPAEPVKEIERCAEKPGIIGAKAHPYWHNYKISLLSDACALCEEKGMPMLIHLGVGKVGDFRLLPEKFPRLKVIYAHAGIPYQSGVCDYAGEKDNVYVDLSNMSYVGMENAQEAIKRAGARKCLFGTDGPYFHYGDDRFLFDEHIEKIRSPGLSDEDRKLIEAGNIREIIGK